MTFTCDNLFWAEASHGKYFASPSINIKGKTQLGQAVSYPGFLYGTSFLVEPVPPAFPETSFERKINPKT